MVIALPVVAILSISAAFIAFWKFSTPQAIGILVAVVPLPLVFGIFGFGTDGDGLYASFQIICLSGAIPLGSELADGGAVALTVVMAGLTLSLPAYLMAVIGLVYRSLTNAR